jgi:hypothetical protein
MISKGLFSAIQKSLSVLLSFNSEKKLECLECVSTYVRCQRVTIPWSMDELVFQNATAFCDICFSCTQDILLHKFIAKL